MKLEKPEPLSIPWLCKPVSSAVSGVEILTDGRVKCAIEHDVVRGVTPKMLVWWFSNLEGKVKIGDGELDRYRVWHPRDHLFARYAKRGADGKVGVGSVIHLAEMFGGDPRYLIHVKSEIVKLDETGYIHRPRLHGLRLAEMEYSFEKTHDGTRYRNSLTFGVRGLLGRIVNPILRRLFFDDAHARAWIRHNVEEVGNLTTFLPELYATENIKSAVRCAA